MKTLLKMGVLALFVSTGCAASKPAAEPTTPAAAPAPTAHADGDKMAEPADDPSKPLVKPGDAKVGDRSTCPISHDTFVITADSPHADYNGKTYYFCCPGCAGKFSSDPSKFTTI